MTVDKLTAHLRKAAKKRWEGKTAEQKAATAKKASIAYWDSMTPEARSEEMRRRAKVRAANKAAKAKKGNRVG